ncbi:MAG: class I SAM-dependent methyltransferase [Gemmatimonadota bacterium]
MSKQDKVYQDVYLKGRVVRHGTRSSEERYQAVAQVLQRYQQPFTVLDIGANQGYFSFRIAHEFDAVCVMIEKQAALLENCRKNESHRVVLLQHAISAPELMSLSQSEHFDVVLALNVIHHFRWRWRTAARAIFSLGDTVIIESPPNNDTGSRGKWIRKPINRYLESMPHTVIAETERRRDRPIMSTMRLYERKEVKPPALARVSMATPGIRPDTFDLLGGVYPERDVLIRGDSP